MTEVSNEEPITREEMVAMFGEAMPIEAVALLSDVPDRWTIGQVRAELRKIAQKKLAPASNVSEMEVLEAARAISEVSGGPVESWMFSARAALTAAQQVRERVPLQVPAPTEDEIRTDDITQRVRATEDGGAYTISPDDFDTLLNSRLAWKFTAKCFESTARPALFAEDQGEDKLGTPAAEGRKT